VVAVEEQLLLQGSWAQILAEVEEVVEVEAAADQLRTQA